MNVSHVENTLHKKFHGHKSEVTRGSFLAVGTMELRGEERGMVFFAQLSRTLF